ncbi:MAG: hypothetical protein DCC75_03655 [Proteobacteria bacterium]|nr:MAG: hypothetical protein DCC75_03655 [Pseudomonadota bacterium]
MEQYLSELEQLLAKECSLYEQYGKVLALEEKQIAKRNHEEITNLSQEREVLHIGMRQCQEQRRALLKKVCGDKTAKLSNVIRSKFPEAKRKNAEALISKLRILAKQNQQRNGEFSQLVNFSLKIVSGLASIFWSATQAVVKSYNQHGRLKESFHNASDRQSGVIKKV